MTMHFLARNLLVLLGAAVFGTNAGAAKQSDDLYWYKVEMVVFARTNMNVLEHEFWPENTGHFQAYQTIELIPENGDARMTGELNIPGRELKSRISGQAEAFQILNPKDYFLNQKVYALRKNPRFKVLLHTSWFQAAFDADHKRAVYLHDKLPLPYKETGSEIRPMNVDSEGPEGQSLFGTVRVYVSRFLHVDLDLIYRVAQQVTYYEKLDEMKNAMFLVPENGQFNATGEPITTVAMHGYRLNESRRIKSRELHYFDHPLFGVLLYATPHEFEDEDAPSLKTSGR